MSVKTLRMKRAWTYDELVAEMPETTQPAELWDGELIMPPAPAFRHQEVAQRVEEALRGWVRERSLGVVAHAPLDVVLAPRRVVQPDILYISQGRRAIIQEQIRGVPDLVVEVVSPGTWRRDHIDKKAMYEQVGVQEYWIVDPEAGAIAVLTLEHGGYRLVGRFGRGERARSVLFMGFEVSVDEILG